MFSETVKKYLTMDPGSFLVISQILNMEIHVYRLVMPLLFAMAKVSELLTDFEILERQM